MCVFTFCYWRILAKVRKSAKYFDNCDTVNAHHQTQLPLIKTMVIITVLFSVCWTPNTILFMFYVVDSIQGMESSVWFATVALALFTVCVHPFIYGVRDKAVRKLIGEWLKSCRLYIQWPIAAAWPRGNWYVGKWVRTSGPPLLFWPFL